MPQLRFVLHLHLALGPGEVWERLWDLDRHTAAVPLTSVATVGGGELVDGARFVARTALGPAAVDDVMEVRVWEPPRRAEVDKVGRLLRGTIRVDLAPSAETTTSVTTTPTTIVTGTDLRWEQTYRVRGVPDRLAGLARPAVAAAYLRTLRSILGA